MLTEYLVAVNLQTAWLSPPVALSACFLKGVVPKWNLKDIYGGMMRYGRAVVFWPGPDHFLSADRVVAA